QRDRVAARVAQVVGPPQLWVAYVEQASDLLRASGQRAALLDHLDLAREVLGRQCPAQYDIGGRGRVELQAVAQLSRGVADRLGVEQQLLDMCWSGGDQLDWQPDSTGVGDRVDAIPV